MIIKEEVYITPYQCHRTLHIYKPDDLKEELANLARKVVKELNIRFASVDIIKLKTGELMVIEVNSGVTINKYTEFVANGREIAKSIYKEAIEKMLE